MDQDDQKEWVANERAEFYVEYGQVFPQSDRSGHKTTILLVRNGDKEIKVGDYFGGYRITAIEASQQQLQSLGPGMTAKITMDGVPGLVVHQDSPEFVDWIRRARGEKTDSEG